MEKTAFIFDTNFIVQNNDLNSVVKELENRNYVVYVPQVAIEERIAQECLKIKQEYDNLLKLKDRYSKIANIEITVKYEKSAQKHQVGMFAKYRRLFDTRILPLIFSESRFKVVFERAKIKEPPFVKGSSDKGFKDTLMWLSILDYFKEKGETKVVFVTDDNAFLEQKDVLEEEFVCETGKTIEIKKNTAYREIIEPNANDEKKYVDIPEGINELRDRIEETLDNIRIILETDDWGNYITRETYKTHTPFSKNEIIALFEGLNSFINSHIFERNVMASVLFDNKEGIIDGDEMVSMESLEEVEKLYALIKKEYSSYMDQFYNAAVNILNRNFVPPVNINEELPF